MFRVSKRVVFGVIQKHSGIQICSMKMNKTVGDYEVLAEAEL
jgi:hypothetical protein